MAGRPRQKAIIQELERRTREQFDDDPDATHLDYVIEWVESGRQMNTLMVDITERSDFDDLNVGMLRRYLVSKFGIDVVDSRMAKARVVGSHAKVEEAQQITDDADTSSREELAKAKMRADVRLWHAERINKAELGRGADVNVVVNHNTLHLDALRQRALARVVPVQETVKELATATHARLICVESTQNESEAEDVVIESVVASEQLERNSLPDNSLPI